MNTHVLEIIRSALRLDPPRSLDEAILGLLQAGPLSSSDVVLILQKRRTVVFRAIRRLAAEGRIRRFGHKKWEIANV